MDSRKKTPRPSRAPNFGAVVLVGFVWGVMVVSGQTYRTWDDGHSSDDWSQRNNWTNNNTPGGSSEVARFSNGNAGTSFIDINRNQRTGGMLFDANLTIDITFTRASSELSIRNGSYGIINNSDQTITFENQMGIEANMTWSTTNASGGGLVFEEEIDTDGRTLTFDTTHAANFIDVSGPIIDSGGIIKTGAGVLTLSGTNTFTGSIDVTGGVLSISSQENLGSLSASSNLTLNGGTLRIDGGTVDNDDNTRNLVLGASGGTIDTVASSDTLIWDNGISGSGDLTKTGAGTFLFEDPTTFTGDLNINEGTVEFGGGDNRLADSVDVVIASGATLDVKDRSDDFGSLSGAGTLTSTAVTGGEVVGFGLNNTDTIFSGTITDGVAATLNIEKLGSGNMTLSGNNSFDGTTTVVDGTLTLANDNALGTSAADTVVDAGATLALSNNITVTSDDVANSGTVTNASGTNTFGGIISGSGTVTTDGGQLTLTGANTYTGDTTINAGSTLVAANNSALGSSSNDTTINSGGTLALDTGVTLTQANVTLAGTGNGGAGAIQNIAGTNQLTANFSLTADATITSAAGDLILGTDPGYNNYAGKLLSNNGHDLTVDGSGDTTFYAGLSGAGDLTKTGSGTLTIEGTVNPGSTTTYTGETFVNEGELVLATLYNDAPGVGPLDDFFIYNDITVGDGAGVAGSAQLTLGTNEAGGGNDYANMLDSGVSINVNTDGALDTQGHTTYVQDINMDGGTINADNSGSTGNNLFITGDITATHASQTSTIDGKLDFNADATKEINVTSSGGLLDINARIQNGGIEKTGTGTLVLSGSNTFTDNVDVSQGIVRIDHNNALGAVAGSTNVDSGAQLQLDGVSIGNEALTLNGSGISSDGALQTVTGTTNSWSGNVTVASAAEIEVTAASSLTISGTIAGSGQTLTVDSAGAATFSGSNTYNTLNKTGSGSLTLSGGTKTISTTNVSAGTLTLGTSNILADAMDLNVSGTGTFAMGGAINDTIDQLNVSGGALDIDGILTMNGGTLSGGTGAASTGELILTAGNTLNVTNDFNFGGTLELTANTTLALAGDGTTFDVGTLKVTGDTVIDFGAGVATELALGTLEIVGSGTTITVNNWVSFQDLWTTGSFNGGSGGVTIDERDDNTAQITFDGFEASDTIWLTFDYGANEITVPESGSYGAILMASGLAAWLLRRPRRVFNPRAF